VTRRAQIADQVKFVAWWDGSVRKPGGDRQSKKALTASPVNALPVKEAEKLTGMKQQRVSDLGKRLGGAVRLADRR
jgi:hypothetical protein